MSQTAIRPPAGLAYRKVRDRVAEGFLLAAALVAVFTTLAIVVVLVRESLPFFEHVTLREFLTDTMWTPLFAEARSATFRPVPATRVPRLAPLAAGVPPGRTIPTSLSEFARYGLRE